jgi:peptidoglycan hydrolase CwlO-like protein
MNDEPTYNGGFQSAEWIPMVAKQRVTSSAYTSSNPHVNQLEQVTNYIDKLQNAIRELEVRLNDAHHEIAEYIDMIDEKNKKIEGQAKFIDILQRQIAIAETYLVKRLYSTK